MRSTYDWEQLHAEFNLAKVKHPPLPMAAFARSRGIPESTFRKAILRKKQDIKIQNAKLKQFDKELVLTTLSKAIRLIEQL